MAERLLLLPWPPSPLLTGSLEVFQKAPLHLIKASQAPGKAPRPAIFLHFLKTPTGVLKERVEIKEAWMQNENGGLEVLHRRFILLQIRAAVKDYVSN